MPLYLALFGSALVLGSVCCPLPGVRCVLSFYINEVKVEKKNTNTVCLRVELAQPAVGVREPGTNNEGARDYVAENDGEQILEEDVAEAERCTGKEAYGEREPKPRPLLVPSLPISPAGQGSVLVRRGLGSKSGDRGAG